MFKIGDIVVYRNSVCEIVGVREAYFESKDYYVLRSVFRISVTLYAAMEDATPPVLRRTMSKRAALNLIDAYSSIKLFDEAFLRIQANKNTLSERRIKEEYERHMKRYEPIDLIVVIKSAYLRIEESKSLGKRASAVDKKFLRLASRLLYEELAVSLEVDLDEVPELLESRAKSLSASNDMFHRTA